MKCLIVDDQIEIAEVLSFEFEEKGIECDLASNGHDALMLLNNTRYDFLIVDIHMPEMKGHQLMARINEKGLDLPIFLMSSLSPFTRDEAKSLGAIDLIQKPFDFNQIVTQILTKLSEK